jgi:hypothetical protein
MHDVESGPPGRQSQIRRRDGDRHPREDSQGPRRTDHRRRWPAASSQALMPSCICSAPVELEEALRRAQLLVDYAVTSVSTYS